MFSLPGLALLCTVFILVAAVEESFGDEYEFTDLQKGVLEEHNKLRARHQAGVLKLDAELCKGAQNEADKKMMHFVKTGKISQNAEDDSYLEYNDNTLAYRSFSKKKWTPYKVVEEWIKQGKYHDWTNNFFNSSTGHFTQMIWASTELIGVGEASGRSSQQHYLRLFVVRYAPPGNILDRDTFAENVLPCLNSTVPVASA